MVTLPVVVGWSVILIFLGLSHPEFPIIDPELPHLLITLLKLDSAFHNLQW